MRYRLRTLLILLAAVAIGCHKSVSSQGEILRHGGEAMEKHAREIERASKPEKTAEPNP
jgi:hypothetical protein